MYVVIVKYVSRHDQQWRDKKKDTSSSSTMKTPFLASHKKKSTPVFDETACFSALPCYACSYTISTSWKTWSFWPSHFAASTLSAPATRQVWLVAEAGVRTMLLSPFLKGNSCEVAVLPPIVKI